MNSSHVLKLAILTIAIAVTVLPKAIGLGDVKRPTRDDLNQAIVKLLQQQGFETQIVSRFGGALVFVKARRDNCRLDIQEAPEDGHNLDAIKADTPKDARLVFAFRGKLLDQHPTTYATALNIWTRVKWRLGVESALSPVVAIAATDACALEKLPWSELSELIPD